jgi:hypothetical protein
MSKELGGGMMLNELGGGIIIKMIPKELGDRDIVNIYHLTMRKELGGGVIHQDDSKGNRRLRHRQDKYYLMMPKEVRRL